MIWWVFALAFLSILSYLSDVGVLTFLNIRVPMIHASLLSLLILLSALGLLSRILYMKRKGQREKMEKRIQELEGKLAAVASIKK
jgi:membrane protein implicated in regulation of membrane protease activity